MIPAVKPALLKENSNASSFSLYNIFNRHGAKAPSLMWLFRIALLGSSCCSAFNIRNGVYAQFDDYGVNPLKIEMSQRREITLQAADGGAVESYQCNGIACECVASSCSGKRIVLKYTSVFEWVTHGKVYTYSFRVNTLPTLKNGPYREIGGSYNISVTMQAQKFVRNIYIGTKTYKCPAGGNGDPNRCTCGLAGGCKEQGVLSKTIFLGSDTGFSRQVSYEGGRTNPDGSFRYAAPH